MASWLHATPAAPEAFAEPVTAVCAVYQQAPTLDQHGVHVISPEEQPGIQARERAAPTVPLTPRLVERPAYASRRPGTRCFIATCTVAPGEVVPPTLGPRRTEADGAAPSAPTLATDPQAAWSFVVDQLHPHPAATWVHVVASTWRIAEDLGAQEKRGVLQSMETRAAVLSEVSHRMRWLSTPKQTSWLPHSELWGSLLVRRVLQRGNCTAVEHVQERLVACIHYVNKTMAKPFQWTYAGRPLTV